MMAVVHDLAEAQGATKAKPPVSSTPLLSSLLQPRHILTPLLPIHRSPLPYQSATSPPEKAYRKPKSAGSRPCVLPAPSLARATDKAAATFRKRWKTLYTRCCTIVPRL